MQTTILKKLDRLCQIYPRRFNVLKKRRTPYPRPCLIRPGGLGDLVVLTRACRELGIDLQTFDWIVEKRNATWLDFLGVNHRCYDDPKDVASILSDYGKYNSVIVSEQYHGLAAVVGSYLTAADGRTIGFDRNPRADLYDQCASHLPAQNHELLHFSQLLQCAQLSSTSAQTTNVSQKDKCHLVLAFAGEYCPTKVLGVEEWELLFLHACSYQQPIYVVGTKTFTEIANSLCRKFPSVINQVGAISFAEVVKTIQTASRFVGIDSGLMHVADFYNVPSDVVFLNSAVTQWQPQTSGSNIATIPATSPSATNCHHRQIVFPHSQTAR